MVDRVELSLKRAKDDAAPFSDTYQIELRKFAAQMSHKSQRAFAMDSVSGGGGPIGEFIFTNANALIASVTTVAGAWIAARAGRKVKLKVGDVEVEAATQEDVEKLLALAQTFKDDNDPDLWRNEDPP